MWPFKKKPEDKYKYCSKCIYCRGIGNLSEALMCSAPSEVTPARNYYTDYLATSTACAVKNEHNDCPEFSSMMG